MQVQARQDVVARLKAMRPRMEGLAFRMLKSRQDAEDVAQEAIVGILTSRLDLDQVKRFEPYALKATRNRALNLIELRSRRVVEMLATDRELPSGELPDIEDPEATDFAAEIVDLDAANCFLSGLPKHYSEVLGLTYDGLDYHEIGRVTGKPLGTVRSGLSRARTFAQRALARQGEATHA